MCGEEIRNALAENIKLLRAQQKLSQADLAYKAEISIPFLSSIERGTKWPYLETLAKLSFKCARNKRLLALFARF